MVTQPLMAKEESPTAIGLADTIVAHRMISESLLWQTIPLHWGSLVDSDRTLAHISTIADPLASQLSSLDASSPVTNSNRLQMLVWQLAAQNMPDQGEQSCLLFRVQSQNSFRDQLFDWLELSRQWLPNSSQVGVLVPWEWATNSPNSIKLCSELRSWGATLAFFRLFRWGRLYRGDGARSSGLYDYGAHVLRGVSDQARRLQRLEIVQASCEAAGIRTVLPVDLTEDDEIACRQLGIGPVSSESYGITRVRVGPFRVPKSDSEGFARFNVIEPQPCKPLAPLGLNFRPDIRWSDRLGSGGYGEVWRATAPGGVEKAIKVVFGHCDEDLAERELKSLERIKGVRHPFVLSLERYEIVNGRLIIVTELADMSLEACYQKHCRAGLPGIPRNDLLGYLSDAADCARLPGGATFAPTPGHQTGELAPGG